MDRPEPEEQETPELINTDYKEYVNANGYYLKVIYYNDELSIIIYNMNSLDGIRYELKMELINIYKINMIFRKLGTIEEIFKKIIKLIDDNKYKIIKKEDNLKLVLILLDNNDQNKDNEISFILSKNTKENKKDYIQVLSNSIVKLKDINRLLNEENKAIKKEKKDREDREEINLNSINFRTEEKEISKSFSLNCDKCLLTPYIILDNFNIPSITSSCPNGHIIKKIDLLSFAEKRKINSENLKCKCEECKNNNRIKKELFYCKNCKRMLCERSSSKHNSEHKKIMEKMINYYCIDHKIKYSYFCNDCNKNICNSCLIHHENHFIIELKGLILSDQNFNKIKDKKNIIILNLKKINQLLDSFKKEFIEKIEKLKKIYEIEIKLFEEIINLYSKGIYNYHIIKNLENISNFSLDENIINENDSFYEKTIKLLKIFNNINNQNNNKIKLINSNKLDETVYSLCFLKKYNLIAMGLDKKINLYDLELTFISSNKILENKIAYISELMDGKIIAADLNKVIKIMKIKDGNLEIYKKIETKEDKNFVVIEISNKSIICGGNQYLSIIESSFFFGYSLNKTIDLKSFISNIVELDSNSFLVGKSHEQKIIVYSNKNYEPIYQIDNINLRSNNYSISKISDDLIGIAGWDKVTIAKACVFILSIEKRKICSKFYIDDIKTCNVILRLINKQFVVLGTGRELDKHSDLILLKYKYEDKDIRVNKICDFKRGQCDETEAAITINNIIIASDSSSNLKIWKVE